MIIFSYILSLIIITLTFVNYLFIIAVLGDKLLSKSNDIFQYKSNNIKLTIFLVILYILTFFILLYAWRVYNMDRILNLKRLFDDSHRLWLINISHIDLLFQYCFVLIIIFIFIILIILILEFHKYFLLNIFKIYLYYYYLTEHNNYCQSLYNLFGRIGSTDIISHSLVKLAFKTAKRPSSAQYKSLPPYHYLKIISFIVYKNHGYVQKLITISPIIIVFYDILFNEYTLNILYKYLLMYIPLITLRRITHTAATDASALMRILKTMYYEKEHNVLYAIDKKNKELLDKFIMLRLRCDDIDFVDLQFHLASIIRFQLNDIEKNLYVNSEGTELKLTSDYKVFKYTEDHVFLTDITRKEGWDAYINSNEKACSQIIPKLGEEWKLLHQKYDKPRLNKKKNRVLDIRLVYQRIYIYTIIFCIYYPILSYIIFFITFFILRIYLYNMLLAEDKTVLYSYIDDFNTIIKSNNIKLRNIVIFFEYKTTILNEKYIWSDSYIKFIKTLFTIPKPKIIYNAINYIPQFSLEKINDNPIRLISKNQALLKTNKDYIPSKDYNSYLPMPVETYIPTENQPDVPESPKLPEAPTMPENDISSDQQQSPNFVVVKENLEATKVADVILDSSLPFEIPIEIIIYENNKNYTHNQNIVIYNNENIIQNDLRNSVFGPSYEGPKIYNDDFIFQLHLRIVEFIKNQFYLNQLSDTFNDERIIKKCVYEYLKQDNIISKLTYQSLRDTNNLINLLILEMMVNSIITTPEETFILHNIVKHLLIAILSQLEGINPDYYYQNKEMTDVLLKAITERFLFPI
jgi:hypothetical protein